VLDAVLWIAVALDKISLKSTHKWFNKAGSVILLYQTKNKA
jgi:hypothetical protein